MRPEMPLDETGQELVDGLLGAVTRQWSALGGTTVAGLREAFLQREGILEYQTDLIRLKVMPKAYDMLLDRIPWSYGVVKFAWMPKPVHVEWRNVKHG